MLEVSLQLKKDMPSKPVYKQCLELVTTLSNDTFRSICDRHEQEGWKVYSWTVTTQCPWDEGFAAAKAGLGINANPYALLSQNHFDWWEGLKAGGEAN